MRLEDRSNGDIGSSLKNVPAVVSSLAHRMSSFLSFNNLAPKTKNIVVAGGLTSFVFGVYFYTMRAVGGTDELQVAIDKFEEQGGSKKETEPGLSKS